MGWEPRCGHVQFFHYVKFLKVGNKLQIIPCNPKFAGYELVGRAERMYKPGFCKIGIVEINKDIKTLDDWDRIIAEKKPYIPFSEEREEEKKCELIKESSEDSLPW